MWCAPLTNPWLPTPTLLLHAEQRRKEGHGKVGVLYNFQVPRKEKPKLQVTILKAIRSSVRSVWPICLQKVLACPNFRWKGQPRPLQASTVLLKLSHQTIGACRREGVLCLLLLKVKNSRQSARQLLPSQPAKQEPFGQYLPTLDKVPGWVGRWILISELC